jgi:hypothetical protein
MAADDNPFSQLSPAEQAYLLGGSKQQGAPASTSTTTSTPTAAASVSPFTGGPPDADPVRVGINAFVGGMYNVGSSIVRNLGFTPNQLPPDAQAAMAAHPVLSTAGNLTGGAIVAAPIAAGAEVAAPLVGLGTGLGSSIATGAATGAAQNALTGNPDESLARRAITGGVLGAGGGWLGNRIGRMFGSDATLATQGVQDAGNTAKAAGIDVLPGNLPQAGSTAAQTATPKGVPATPGQIQQVNKAFGNIVGGDVNDFSAANLGPLTNKVGSEISTAVNQGQVQMTPTLESQLQTVLQNAHAPGIDPLVTAKIEAEVDKVLSIAPNMGDTVAGSQFDRLVGAGSKLSKYTGDANQDLSGLARQLDTTLDGGFQASSKPGVYDQYVDAKTRYRMLKAIEDNVEGDAAGNIKPGSIMADINRRFPNMPTQTGPGTVGQASDLARAVTTLFGGGQGAPGAVAAGSGWLTQHPLLAGALGAGGVGGVYQAATNPAALGNLATWGASHIPVVGLGAAAFGARNLLSRVGAAYQRSPAFANALLQRGTQQVANPLAAYTGAVAAVPDQWRRQ